MQVWQVQIHKASSTVSMADVGHPCRYHGWRNYFLIDYKKPQFRTFSSRTLWARWFTIWPKKKYILQTTIDYFKFRHNIKSGIVADKKVKLAAVDNCTGLSRNNGRRAMCEQLTCNNYHTKKPTKTKLAEIFLHSFPNHHGTYIAGPDIKKTPNDRRLTI